MTPAPAAQRISVIVPVYDNAELLPELHWRLQRVLGGLNLGYEVIFVDDASRDASLRILREIAAKDPQVAIVALEKNVGQHRAVLVGLHRAQGEWVVVLDADLQDPPEAIPELFARLRKDEVAAVFAGRRGRYESHTRLLTSRLFKWLLHVLCGVPADAGLFVAMNREMVERLRAFAVSSPFLVAMMGCSGLPLASVPVPRNLRPQGRSAYSFWDRLRVGFRALLWTIRWKWSARRFRRTGKRDFRSPALSSSARKNV